MSKSDFIEMIIKKKINIYIYSEITFAGLTGLYEQLIMRSFFIIVSFACVEVIEFERVVFPQLV